MRRFVRLESVICHRRSRHHKPRRIRSRSGFTTRSARLGTATCRQIRRKWLWGQPESRLQHRPTGKLPNCECYPTHRTGFSPRFVLEQFNKLRFRQSLQSFSPMESSKMKYPLRYSRTNGPNHALQRTADRRETLHMTTSTLKSVAQRVFVGGR